MAKRVFLEKKTQLSKNPKFPRKTPCSLLLKKKNVLTSVWKYVRTIVDSGIRTRQPRWQLTHVLYKTPTTLQTWTLRVMGKFRERKKLRLDYWIEYFSFEFFSTEINRRMKNMGALSVAFHTESDSELSVQLQPVGSRNSRICIPLDAIVAAKQVWGNKRTKFVRKNCQIQIFIGWCWRTKITVWTWCSKNGCAPQNWLYLIKMDAYVRKWFQNLLNNIFASIAKSEPTRRRYKWLVSCKKTLLFVKANVEKFLWHRFSFNFYFEVCNSTVLDGTRAKTWISHKCINFWPTLKSQKRSIQEEFQSYRKIIVFDILCWFTLVA